MASPRKPALFLLVGFILITMLSGCAGHSHKEIGALEEKVKQQELQIATMEAEISRLRSEVKEATETVEKIRDQAKVMNDELQTAVEVLDDVHRRAIAMQEHVQGMGTVVVKTKP